MPTLQEILQDPNYVNANPATKQAIFERWAPQDTNFSSANGATQAAIRQRFGVGAVAEPEPQPQEESGFLRQVADVPLNIGKGTLSGIRMIADSFGAGSKASEAIKGAEGYLSSLMSAQAKNDEQEIARIMKDAEDKGVLDQVKAGLKAFSVAPVDLISQGLGTAAPAILGLLGGNVLGVGAVGARAIGAGIGAAMGAGTAKGNIYEATKEELVNAGLPEDQAEQRAQLAQEYGGKNLDQILLSTGLGAFASSTGVESATKRILMRGAAKQAAKKTAEEATEKGALAAAKTIGKGAIEEAAPEFLQAGQEQVAQNIALQREGFDTPTFRGAVGSGTLEALAGAGMGAGFGAVETSKGALKSKAKKDAAKILEQERALQEEQPAPTQERAQAPVDTGLEDLERQFGMATAKEEPATAEDMIRDEFPAEEATAAPTETPAAVAEPAAPEAKAEEVAAPETPAATAPETGVQPPAQKSLQDVIRDQEPATKYDTPEQNLRESDAFGQDLLSLIKGELDNLARAGIKNRKVADRVLDMRESWTAASEAAKIAFAENNYEVFRPYEQYFKKTAKALQTKIEENQKTIAEIEKPSIAAEEMEGAPVPRIPEVQAEVEKLTEDQAAAVAERDRLQKRTAGNSLMQVLKGKLVDGELSELGGRGRQVGKNQFLNLKASKDKVGSSMEDVVNTGALDIFLPENMRTDHPDYVDSESAEYIREKLRNNEFYTYETELAIKRVEQDIESIERQIQDLLSDDEINKELQYAADEQRELDKANQEFAPAEEDRAPEQREAKTADDELDRREAQLKREAELNEREAKLLEERKQLEEKRLELEKPTEQQVLDQEERKAKAAELDEREQVRKESEAGAGQFELTREEGRQDTTKNLFEQPEEKQEPEKPKTLAVSVAEERKRALSQLKTKLAVPVPQFRAVSAGKTTMLKPTPFTRPQIQEIMDLASEALDLGLPAAVLGNVTAGGKTRMDANAVMSQSGWLMTAKKWAESSKAEKLQVLIHELAHAVDTASGMPSKSASWKKAHTELKNWYDNSREKLFHPLRYPFAAQFQGRVRVEMESFAQAFAFYFTSPVDLQKNAPEAYSQIQSIVERIQNESQQARAAGTTKTGTAGIKIQPSRSEKDTAVQPAAGTVGTGISPAQGRKDRGAGEVTDTPAFKRWFGDSKVVDADGKPLVVYHGSNESITQFDPFRDLRGNGLMFFSKSKDGAEMYGSVVHPVYLSAQKLFDAHAEFPESVKSWIRQNVDRIAKEIGNYRKEFGLANSSYFDPSTNRLDAEKYIDAIKSGEWQSVEASKSLIQHLKNDGFDGVKFYEDGDTYAVFSPAQIKSATGNQGTFDPETADINMMQAPEKGRQNVLGEVTTGNWTLQPDTKLDTKDSLIYKLLDKNIDLKRVVQAIKGTGREIATRWNPYLQEELYHGRTAYQTKTFTDKEVAPLIEEMDKSGVTIGEFEQYLHNRHAEAYNKHVAKVNPNTPEMQDGGSGIATEDARKYLADLPADKKKLYESLAKRIDEITKGTRELLVDSGLEKRETIEAWEKTFPDYVPLMREEEDFEYTTNSFGVGQGFDVRGSFSKRAMGSKRNVVDILANAVLSRERAIVKAEKNRVAQAVYGLALQNGNPNFWLAVNPMAEKVPQVALDELTQMNIDPEAIKFLMKEPRQRAIDPNKNEVISRINTTLRKNGNVLSMRLNGENRYVFFNPNNERAKRAATALKNLDAQQLGTIMGYMSRITRFMSAMNTQYNPIFGTYNFLRDVQGAALQLSTTPIAGKQKEVGKNVLPAMKAIFQSLRKGEPADTEMGKLWNDFQEAGGQTGFRDMYSRSQDRAEALLDEFKKMSEGRIKKAGRHTFQLLSDYNDTMENAVRLSAYKVALESGYNKDEAASIAKNLTVNFNRKGDIATQAGALYAFFNAAMQGSARLYETLKGPAGKKIMYGGLLWGVMQSALLAMAGFDEEEPPDFVRERNFIIPIFGTKKYIAFPMPLGYHVIPGLSRQITDATLAYAGVLKSNKTGAERVADLTGMFLEAFNPIGNAGWSMQTLAPTPFDPFVALFENKDWTGKKIYKEDLNKNDPTPGYTRARESATWLGTQIAKFLNLATGGTKYQPGIISPTPEQLEYLASQATGGVGREVGKMMTVAENLVTGEEVPSYKIPLAGRFYGDAQSSAAESSRFYRNLEHINKLENEIKGRRDNKEPLGDFLLKNPEARLAGRGRQIQEDIKKLRDRKEKLIERNSPRESIKAVEEQIARKQKQFNDQVASFKK